MKKQLFARQWRTTVRKNESDLYIETVYLDKFCEVEGWFTVNPGDFKILEACIDVYRGPWERGRRKLDGLLGREAYLGSSKIFLEAAQEDKRGIWAEVMLEGLKGLLQAEFWIHKERGYSSFEDYERYFQDGFADSCVYYSNLEKVKTKFYQHAGSARGDLLFTRHRSSFLEEREGRYYLTGSLMDSFHQMALAIEVSEDRKVLAAKGQVIRSVDEICKKGEEQVANLLGETVSPRGWQKSVGGAFGCTHLADLARELARTFQLS